MASSKRPYNAWVAQKYRNLSPTPTTLNRRVQVWRNGDTKNEVGQKSRATSTLLRTVWAQIVPKTGSMTYQQTETILTDVTHVVTMRYFASKDIDVGDYLVYDGRRFDIRYKMNVYEANWMIAFDCLEVQDT